MLNGFGVIAAFAAYRYEGKAAIVTTLAAAVQPLVTVVLALLFLGERIGLAARGVGHQAFGEAFGNDAGDALAQQLVARIAELLLGMDVDEHDPAGPVDHHHGIGRRLEQAAVLVLEMGRVLRRGLV